MTNNIIMPFKLSMEISLFLMVVCISTSSTFTSNIEPRIWQGVLGNIEDHKWLVSISISPPTEFMCAGTLIAPRWVLTLGFCTRFKNVSYWVRAGSDLIYDGGVTIHVDQIYRLSQYQFIETKDFMKDLALLKLDNDLEGDAIGPVKLPNELEFLALGAIVNVTGWGQPEDNYQSAASVIPFRCLAMSVINMEQYNSTDLNLLLFDEYGQGACLKDVGSPVVLDGTLYGIILPGHKCGIDRLYSSIMVQITKNVRWIRSIMNMNSTRY